MAAVDKFGAAFAIGFMAVMLVIMMGGLTPDGSFSGTSESETSMSTPTYSPPVQSTPPETVTTPPERESLTGFLKYTIRGGGVDSISNNPDANSVTVLLDNNVDGQLIITMTKDAITPFDDGTYFVTIDGEENHDFVQVGQRLTIDFLAGSEEITIFGISDNLVSKAAADAAAADAAAADAAAADAAAADAAAADAAAADEAAAAELRKQQQTQQQLRKQQQTQQQLRKQQLTQQQLSKQQQTQQQLRKQQQTQQQLRKQQQTQQQLRKQQQTQQQLRKQQKPP